MSQRPQVGRCSGLRGSTAQWSVLETPQLLLNADGAFPRLSSRTGKLPTFWYASSKGKTEEREGDAGSLGRAREQQRRVGSTKPEGIRDGGPYRHLLGGG